MKKFISMVMAAAMVVSLVPATAFAANEATFKVVKDMELTKTDAEDAEKDGLVGDAQLQIKVKDVDNAKDVQDKYDIKLHINNAEVRDSLSKLEMSYVEKGMPYTQAYVIEEENDAIVRDLVNVTFLKDVEKEDDVFSLRITEAIDKQGVLSKGLSDGDIIVLPLIDGTFVPTTTKVGTEMTVKVTGDFGTSDEMVFATIVDKALDVEVDDTVDVAEEETATLEEITVEPSVGDTIGENATWDKKDQAKFTLKLSKGFEFANTGDSIKVEIDGRPTTVKADIEDDEITITMNKGKSFEQAAELVFTNLVIEATTAKAGDVATLTVGMDDVDSVKVEVATVVDYKVIMSVDEDEDVPVFYNGVNSDNDGLTVDDDHEALLVTIEETFPGAWSNHKEWTLSLPEGVHVVDVVDVAGTLSCDEATLLADAYKEGDHEYFEVEKRVFDETEPGQKENSIEFALVVTADPDFVGDVVLTLEGDAVDTQEVVIAKFVAPFTVKAEQNDLKIDYRYTEVGSDIVVTEAEAGLWEKGLEVGFQVDRGGYIQFEDDAVFTVNEGSDMEVDDFTIEEGAVMGFVVDEESDEEAAVVTISGIELFMQRNIPAGPYDLDLFYGEVTYNEKDEKVLSGLYDAIVLLGQDVCDHDDCDSDNGGKNIEDICDYSTTVKEGWINVVTAGREADDASFTTKVVVPVGEAYIIAGEAQVALDVPAYVNAAGYTMLPVRAVAVALGINTQNVLWDQATKTVTILYGQRIITMQVGAKVVYVNGSAIPASASVEIVDGRTFLPMRDLATALGVTDITWDAAT
ncbi:copper amine oxidase N-terminal domain-containing protein, partial [Anaerotignum sp.]